MSNEDLLKPRYEVIAEDTSGDFNKGDVLRDLYGDGMLYGSISTTGFTQPLLDKYPHLFRKLHWAEKRDLKDLPQHISINKKVYKIDLWETYLGNRPRSRAENSQLGIDWHFHKHESRPATKQEYTQYINQK